MIRRSQPTSITTAQTNCNLQLSRRCTAGVFRVDASLLSKNLGTRQWRFRCRDQ